MQDLQDWLTDWLTEVSNDDNLALNKGNPGEYILREVISNKRQVTQRVTEKLVWYRELTDQNTHENKSLEINQDRIE